MIKINLVPQEILAKESQRQQSIQAGVGAGIFLIVLIGVTFVHWRTATRLEKELQEKQAEFDKLKKIVEQVEELERTAGAVHTRLGVITDLLKGRPLYPYFMRDLAQTVPADVWLISVNTSSKGGNQLGLLLQASSGSDEGVTTWMRNLKNSGSFGDPVISGISTSGGDAGKTHSFSLTTNYKNPKL